MGRVLKPIPATYGRNTPEWDACSLQGPIWAFGGLLPCYRVLWQCWCAGTSPAIRMPDNILSTLGLELGTLHFSAWATGATADCQGIYKNRNIPMNLADTYLNILLHFFSKSPHYTRLPPTSHFGPFPRTPHRIAPETAVVPAPCLSTRLRSPAPARTTVTSTTKGTTPAPITASTLCWRGPTAGAPPLPRPLKTHTRTLRGGRRGSGSCSSHPAVSQLLSANVFVICWRWNPKLVPH